MRAYQCRAFVFLGGVVCLVALVGCDREPAAWSSAKGKNTVEAYESYLKEHAAGPHALEAKQLLAERQEDRTWDKAKSTGTIEGVDTYLAAYPQGRLVTDAKKLRDGLVETQEWTQAKAANTVDSVESFLRQYPQTQRKAEAEHILLPLREARDWKKAKDDNTIESLGKFLSQYPSSTHASQANALLVPLRESATWAQISQKPSVEAVEKFISQYPQSPRGADAQAVLRALRWASADAQNGRAQMMGMYMGGYQRFISAFEITHDLTCDLGSANVHYTIDAGKGYLDMTRDGKKIARNGIDPKVTGSIDAKQSGGAATTTKIVGIIWSKDENLLGSCVYSYDTHLGITNAKQFDGLAATPPIDGSKRICAFKIGPDGTLTVQP